MSSPWSYGPHKLAQDDLAAQASVYFLALPNLLAALNIFKIMDSILNSFVWGNSQHKVSWRVLKKPTELGGAALPDLHAYYLASQLSHFFYFDKEDKIRYLSLACSAVVTQVAHPFSDHF